MANAKRDQNSVHTMTAALNTDGSTIVNVKVNASNHGIMVDDNTTGTGFGVVNAIRDENDVPIFMGVSSRTATVNGINYVQGVTPVAVYANSSGGLLINSN